MKNFYVSLFAVILLVSFGAKSKTMTEIQMDSTVRNHKIVFFGKGEEPSIDSTTLLIRNFYEDQFRHFQDPLAPYFLFMSKDANLAMGVGGVVRMRGYYDWGGSIPSPAFAPYLIPMVKNPEHERRLGTTPAGTALFFRVIGRNKKFGNYQLYIEANFNGYQARDFHLKKAYGQINDFTIGYTNSTFSDPGALPPVIDAGGPNAKIDATTVLIRWMHSFKKGWSMAASIESPNNSIDTDDQSAAKVDQYIPDISAFGQYAWKSGYLRLAGITRYLSYRNLVQLKNHTKLGWGLQLSGKWQPETHFTLYGAFNGGRGYSSLGGDWLMGKYDLVPTPDKKGSMYSPYTIGGYGAVQYNLNPSMFFSATCGERVTCLKEKVRLQNIRRAYIWHSTIIGI